MHILRLRTKSQYNTHTQPTTKNNNITNQKMWLPLFMGLLFVLFISACNSGNSSKPDKVVKVEPPVTPVSFLTKLNDIEGIQASLISSPVADYRLYDLLIEQPKDHNNTDMPSFQQRVRLLMKDEQSPVVLNTLGYGMGAAENTKLTEITTMVNATQIDVEHRFFRESTPENVDWSLMTIEQAASDHHRVISLLKPLLSANWIATGKSKGGMAATYLKRFYPEDVRGVVAYVAPLSLSMWDERFSDYTQQVVSNECQTKYKNFQVEALLRLDQLVEMIDAWGVENNVTMNSHGFDLNHRLQVDIALSWITIGSYYPELLCEYLPVASDETEVFLEFIYQTSGFEYITDEGLTPWLPYHIQAARELGNFSAPLSHIADLLTVDVKDFEVNMLGNPVPVFQPEVMQDIYEWAQFEASHMIFIYGEQDIFTGGAYPITTDESRENQIYIEPGLHGINIEDLMESSQQQINEALSRWSQ